MGNIEKYKNLAITRDINLGHYEKYDLHNSVSGRIDHNERLLHKQQLIGLKTAEVQGTLSKLRQKLPDLVEEECLRSIFRTMALRHPRITLDQFKEMMHDPKVLEDIPDSSRRAEITAALHEQLATTVSGTITKIAQDEKEPDSDHPSFKQDIKQHVLEYLQEGK